MDPLRLAIAVVPLATYLLVLGWINLRRHPLLVGGTADGAALAAALAGLVIVGPLELFMPLAAAARFGVYVWLFLIAFYGLCASLVVLMLRPRLVIYNTTPDVLRPVLANVVSELDTSARWAGRSVVLPNVGIEFHLEATEFMRNVSLVAAGDEQNLSGWRQLELSLRPALKHAATRRGARGPLFIACAAALLVTVLAELLLDPQAVAFGVQQILRP